MDIIALFCDNTFAKLSSVELIWYLMDSTD